MKGPTPVLSYKVEVVCHDQDGTKSFSVTDAETSHVVDVTEPFRAYLCALFSGNDDPRVVRLEGGVSFAKIPLTESHVRRFWPA